MYGTTKYMNLNTITSGRAVAEALRPRVSNELRRLKNANGSLTRTLGEFASCRGLYGYKNSPKRDIFHLAGTGIAIEAIELCADCPVKNLCLSEVLRLPGGSERGAGVFGGLTAIERRDLMELEDPLIAPAIVDEYRKAHQSQLTGQ